MKPLNELRAVERAAGRRLEDREVARVIAGVRAAGAINDADWACIVDWYQAALAAAAREEAEADANPWVIQLNAVNENWIPIGRIQLRIGCEIPGLVGLWLVELGCERGDEFWRPVDKALRGLGLKKLEG